MHGLGWIEGQNLTMEYRWADGDLLRLPALAAELGRLQLEVILTAGSSGVRAARQAGSATPVVAAIMGDPVALGVAASLSRPGGTVTGLAVQFEDLVAKQLQLLKDTVPKAIRVAILDHVAFASTNRAPAETAARALGLA